MCDACAWGSIGTGRSIKSIPQKASLHTIESNRFVTGVTWIDGELWHGTWVVTRAICTQVVLAEGFTLGVKAGVDPEALRQAVTDGAVGQGVILNYMLPNVVFKDDFDTVRFALKLARKDIGLATDLARECSVPLKIGNLVEQDHIEAMSRGWGDRDSTVPFALQEECAGVKVRKAKA